MTRFCLILSFTLLVNLNAAWAHEFSRIDHFFDLLAEEYVEKADFKQISLNSSKSLTQFDSQIKIYRTDKDIFLYHKNKLIFSFSLPIDNTPDLWKQFMHELLNAALKNSPLLNKQALEVETTLLENMTKHLDEYSRIDDYSSPKNSFEATLRNNSLYIKLISFANGQAESIKQIISQYPNIDGIILDLRGNHGGKFSEAIKITDLFLDNALITFSQEKNRPKRFYTSHPGDVLKGKPIAILTNEYTASAAEIVATALNEQSRAVLIGAKTYGKSSIQHVHQLNDKVLYLTSGYFYSPSGKNINHIGIRPEICTTLDKQCLHSDLTNPEKDITIALEFIKNTVS